MRPGTPIEVSGVLRKRANTKKRMGPSNKGMQLTKPGQLRSFAADPQCSTTSRGVNAVSIASVLDAAFSATLERHGFVPFNSEACSYVLRRSAFGSELHVDVHLVAEPPHFSVVLQDVHASAPGVPSQDDAGLTELARQEATGRGDGASGWRQLCAVVFRLLPRAEIR